MPSQKRLRQRDNRRRKRELEQPEPFGQAAQKFAATGSIDAISREESIQRGLIPPDDPDPED